jgi:membrane associated rhomboid family serine protease
MSVCYRHPSNEAYVRCQRCERFICPQCQVGAPVGFLCPEDAGQTAAAALAGVRSSATATARLTARRISTSATPITWALIAINAAVWGIQLLVPAVTNYLVFWPVAALNEPWRMITSGFAHDPSSVLHILFNMYSLFVLGRVLEPLIGSVRFTALYMISLFAGSVAFLTLSELNAYELGASGAIFGLMGAYFVILRALGGQLGQVAGIIAINLVFGFLMPNVAWQAHIGGLIGGVVVALIFANTRALAKRKLQFWLVLGFALVLLAAAYFVADYKITNFFGF